MRDLASRGFRSAKVVRLAGLLLGRHFAWRGCPLEGSLLGRLFAWRDCPLEGSLTDAPFRLAGESFLAGIRGANPNAETRFKGLVRAYRSPQAFLARRVSTKVLCRDGVFVGSCPPARARTLGFCSAAGVSFEALAPYSAPAREVRMWRDISAHFNNSNA